MNDRVSTFVQVLLLSPHFPPKKFPFETTDEYLQRLVSMANKLDKFLADHELAQLKR